MNLCFFGKSGAGKTTTADIASSLLANTQTVLRCDVATPLREIQNFCQKTFGLAESGSPLKPGTFASDDQLLGFLANHYEPHLKISFENRFNDYLLLTKTSKPITVINADCRANCYALLKSLGFIFIAIKISETLREKRLFIRDQKLLTSNPVDSIAGMVSDFEITNDGTKTELIVAIKQLLKKLGYIDI